MAAATHEGSDEHVHIHSLARAFTSSSGNLKPKFRPLVSLYMSHGWKFKIWKNPERSKFKSYNLPYAYKVLTISSPNGQLP